MRPPLAERLFASLTRLLPRGFVDEYGTDMTAIFSRRASGARTLGRARFALWVLRDLAGLAGVAVLEHAAALRAAPSSTSSEAPSPMELLRRETRHAARRLIRTPGFTLAALFTLALAIGANTAIFALLHRVVLSPLPYPASDRLVALEHASPGVGLPTGVGMSRGLYREYGALPAVEAIAIHYNDETTLSGEGDAEQLETLVATPSLGGLLGARPARGRWFTESEGVDGAPNVVVLTHAAWVRRFGESTAVLGRVIRLNGDGYEVIGVMPRGFVMPNDRAELILPLRLDPANRRFGGFNFRGIARLRPGVTVDELRRQQTAVIADLVARFPENAGLTKALVGEVRLASLAVPLKNHVLGGTARTLWVLLGSVAIVLLIACANLANLFLVRTDSRLREVAVRRALGAGTSQMSAFFLAEALLVALASGALGLFLGHIAVETLVRLGPVGLPRLHEVHIDGTVVGFTVLASLLAGLSFGLMPLARRLPPVASVLKDAGRGNTAVGGRMLARQALMATQVALAVVLLVAAGLMAQSFHRLQQVNPGFRADSSLVFRIGLAQSEYPTAEAAVAFHELLLERVRGLPGVRRAAFVSTLPLDGEGPGDLIDVRGRPLGPGEVGPVAKTRRASTDYFSAMAIPLRAGRLFVAADASGSTNAAIINEALAALYFPGEDAVDRQIRKMGSQESDGWLTVVGVVGNTAMTSLREPAPVAQLYLPLRTAMNSQVESTHSGSYILQTSGNPIALVPAVRRALGELNPNVAMARPERLEDVVTRAGASLAFTMVLLVLAATVALLLGLVGVYAVISYGVAQRTGEIGLRLALGARPGEVTGMIVRQSGRVIAVGVLLGVTGAVASTRLLGALLFGVAWNDALTYVAVAFGIFAVAMVACWLPARRAGRLDPLESLRGG